MLWRGLGGAGALGGGKVRRVGCGQAGGWREEHELQISRVDLLFYAVSWSLHRCAHGLKKCCRHRSQEKEKGGREINKCATRIRQAVVDHFLWVAVA